MSQSGTESDATQQPRKDGLADERDDPQTQPDAVREVEEENAETSLDQPSGDVG